jgi:hypothetical protein
VFVIHEFVNGKRGDGRAATLPANVKRNGVALDRFLTALSGKQASLEAEKLVGPFCVPGNEYLPGDVTLYIGKTQRDLAAQ